MKMNLFGIRLNLFRRKKPVYRHPRKKIEMNLQKVHATFSQLARQLEQILDEEPLVGSYASSIWSEVGFLEDSQIFEAVTDRIAKIPTSFVEENDISLWLLEYYRDLVIKMETILELEGTK